MHARLLLEPVELWTSPAPLARIIAAIEHAEVTPAALGFWLWGTNTATPGAVPLTAAARARFGIDADQVAILVAELVAAGLVLQPQEARS